MTFSPYDTAMNQLSLLTSRLLRRYPLLSPGIHMRAVHVPLHDQNKSRRALTQIVSKPIKMNEDQGPCPLYIPLEDIERLENYR